MPGGSVGRGHEIEMGKFSLKIEKAYVKKTEARSRV
jgi:GMP synthase-like glutamine amidotransferase